MKRNNRRQSLSNGSDDERQLEPTGGSIISQLAAALQPSSNGFANELGSLEESILDQAKQTTEGFYRPGEPLEMTAKRIKDTLTANCLTESAFNKSWSAQAWYLYCQQILADAEATDDPILQMMVEELTMAHHALQRMFVAVAHPQSLQQAECLYAAIPRLLAEVRRMALAIREYRSPVVSKIVNVVEQQNVAQTQQIAHLATKAPANAEVKLKGEKVLDTEMVSNAPKELTHETQRQFSAKSEKSRGRETEPAKTPRTISGDSATSARRSPPKPTMASDHRPKNRSR